MKTRTIELLRTGKEKNSGRIICSLPLGPEYTRVKVKGASSQAAVPLGKYGLFALRNPQVTGGFDISRIDPWNLPPRRMLIFADFPHETPDRVEVELQQSDAPETLQTPQIPADMVEFSRDGEIYCKRENFAHLNPPLYHYVKCENKIFLTVSGRKYEFIPGWEMPGGEFRRMQWGEVQPHWNTPLCSAFTIGGHIYAGLVDRQLTMEEAKNSENTDLRRERMVSVRAFIRVWSDGLVESIIHYANVQGYGAGDMAFGLPLFKLSGCGEKDRVTTDAADAAVESRDDLRIIKPLKSSLIFQKNGQLGSGMYDGKNVISNVKDSENGFVRGAGFSFGVTFSPAGARQPERCLAPGYWYKRCSLFGIQIPEPAENAPFPELYQLSDLAETVHIRNQEHGGMADGAVYRYLEQAPEGRYECSNDGNEAAFLWRGAYLRGSAELYETSRKASRYIADIAVDHQNFNIHYHSDSPDWNTFSLIYLRFAGLVYSYLEEGDPYHLEIARAVADRWIAVNRQNQPRHNMGRDAEPVEGISILADETGDQHYFDAALEIARDVSRTLDKEYFWRSGFGVGPWWGVNALKGTAWNGAHLLAGIAEPLLRAVPENCPDYTVLLDYAAGMTRRIQQSVREDYKGVHRTSGGFLRRQCLIAQLAEDHLLAEQITEHIQALIRDHREKGTHFFDNGHHCSGYIEQAEIVNAMPLFFKAEK